MVFRALDYLPPGEVSFADYGRAMIAVDSIAYGHDKRMIDWLLDEFLTRKVIHSKDALDIEKEWAFDGLDSVSIEDLHSCDWTAYGFANRHRDFLHIPDEIAFEVLPRLFLTKKYPREKTGYELVFKVSWEVEEIHDIGYGYPSTIRFPVGTTLAMNWETKEILARLTTAPPKQIGKESATAIEEYDDQTQARGEFIKHLAKQGILKRNFDALDPNGKPLLSTIHAQVDNGKMRIRGAGKLLHIIEQGGK
jgi:hypothetical protein